ncbi:glycine-rich domain-containing protein [Rhodococcus erythropolis]
MISRALVLTESGIWVKHPRLQAVETIICRGAGGGGSWPAGTGNGYGGGGGGASRTDRRIGAFELPDEVEYQVGVGGNGGNSTNRNGGNGGDTWFGKLILVSGGLGASTTAPGRGGDGIFRGGMGGTPTGRGESVTSGVIDYMAGGGGGSGGGGGTGGASGFVPGGTSYPQLWQTGQSGGGGNQRAAGGYPAGGGGGGNATGTPAGRGADGLLTIIEYLHEE